MTTRAVHALSGDEDPTWMEKKGELESMRIWVPLKEVLTPTQIDILLFICKHPRQPSGELQEQLRLTKPSVSRHLSRLQQLGLVLELRDNEDRRRKLYIADIHPPI